MPLDYTVGGSAANSYLSVAEGDGFAASDLGLFAKAWLDATTEEKEAALRRATSEIDAYVGVPDVTAYYPYVQSLSFPRVYDVDPLTGAVYLPDRVKRSTYLQAAYLLAAAPQIDEAALRRSKGFTSYANPDGTGGSVATDAGFGRMHPDALRLLGGFDEGSTIGRIILT
jgi:hypothetical protein